MSEQPVLIREFPLSEKNKQNATLILISTLSILYSTSTPPAKHYLSMSNRGVTLMGRGRMKGVGGNNSHSKSTVRLFSVAMMINCISVEVTKTINLRPSCLEKYRNNK